MTQDQSDGSGDAPVSGGFDHGIDEPGPWVGQPPEDRRVPADAPEDDEDGELLPDDYDESDAAGIALQERRDVAAEKAEGYEGPDSEFSPVQQRLDDLSGHEQPRRSAQTDWPGD
jgi:hypothetical protein